MTGGIDWVSATAFLLCGLIAGVMFTYHIVTTSKARRESSDIEERDLRAKVDALVLRLREGEDTGDIDERVRLEQEAALALRRLAELGGSIPQTAGAAQSRSDAPVVQKSGAVAGFLWGVGSMAVIALLAWLVYSASSPKASPQTIAGGDGATPPMAAASAQRSAADPEVIRLRGELKQTPGDISKRLELARRELILEDLISTFNDTEEILKRDPNNAQAMTYQAFVKMAMGQSADAEAMLHRALAIQPDLIDGWVQLAMVETTLGKSADADQSIAEAIKRRPDEEQALRQLLAEMRARGSSAGGQTSAAAAPPQTQGPSVSPEASVGGTIDVPANASPSATLFVFARAAGVTSGPPVAVARFQATPGKMTFELSGANSMLGQQLPSKLRIEARLDSDGNPLTHDPSDLGAVLDNISLGAHDLELRLK